jgi:hypothetical protein
MIRFLTSFTLETDDPLIAANDILKQLDPEHSLLKNSVGLLFCSLDFVLSGVTEAVCKALSFEIIGSTTQGIAVPGAMNENMLAVMVLTSDEVFFSAGVSEPLGMDGENRVQELYKRLSENRESSPSLMLICHANPDYFPGDKAAEVLDHVSGGIPLFGTNALNETFFNRIPLIIHNGTSYSDRLALILVDGTVESRFHVKSLPAMNIYSQPAIVTEVQDNRLISINNIPAIEFMEKFGLLSEAKTNAMIYGFPLLIDNHDGTGSKPCAIHNIENGGLYCGSAIAKGAVLKLVSQIQEEVLHDSAHLAELIKKEDGKKGYLIFSCFGRSAPLVDLKDEMGLFQKHLEGKSYMFVYAGGEFCPIDNEQGEIRNCFHQFSIISLSFELSPKLG